MTARAGRITFAVTLAAGVLLGCAGADAGQEVAADRRQEVATTTFSGRTMPFDLYTHCGIDEARIGSRYFEAKTPLSDGAGSPPAGWGNPTQSGTMTLTSETEAVFTDNSGHVVQFRARPGATAFKLICQ